MTPQTGESFTKSVSSSQFTPVRSTPHSLLCSSMSVGTLTATNGAACAE